MNRGYFLSISARSKNLVGILTKKISFLLQPYSVLSGEMYRSKAPRC